jgi:hypothetical protein
MTTKDDVYEFIKSKDGVFSRDICEHFQFTDMRVQYHTTLLRDMGLIYIAEWKPRTGHVPRAVFKAGNVPSVPRPESKASIRRKMRKLNPTKSCQTDPETKPNFLPTNWFTLTPKNGDTGAKPSTLPESPSE